MTDQDQADDRKYRAPALEKGLDVLELLSSQGEAMTPSQMSVTLGRSVSELFRMIQVLEFRGYIEQSSDGYRLTNRLFTRAYLPGSEPDALLDGLEAERRATLITTREQRGLLFDIHLQGEGETVFLSYPRQAR